jgi:hypothetical protein
MKIDLYVSKGDHLQELELSISQFMPTIIITPSFIDWHEEHINSNKILREVLLKNELNSQILIYQISVPISEKKITHYMPMSYSEQNSKWKYFKKVYRSQKHIPIYRFQLQERLNGCKLDCYAAEAYILLNMKDWERCLVTVLHPFYMEQLSVLNEHINNVKEIRELSSDIYSSVFNKCRVNR